MSIIVSIVVSLFLLVPQVFAATYYVATNGTLNAGAPCIAGGQNLNQMKNTINLGMGCLSPGDTLLVKAGVYDELLDSNIPSGSAGNPVTIKSEVQYGAIIRPHNMGTGIYIVRIDGPRHDIVFDGFVVDGINQTAGTVCISTIGGAHDVVIQNNEVKNTIDTFSSSNSSGISTDNNDYNLTIRNNLIHHMGTNALGDHVNGVGAYGSYTHSQNVLIEGNTYHHNDAYQLHMHAQYTCPIGSGIPCSGYVIRNNLFYHNGLAALIINANFEGVEFYNNIIYDGGLSEGWNSAEGIKVTTGITGVKIYNNTLVANVGPVVADSGNGTVIRNNIFYQNGNNTPQTFGSGAVVSNNLMTTNPNFVSTFPLSTVSALDFRLQAGSPAINFGTPTGAPTVDFGNNTRVGNPDAGAWEQGSAPGDIPSIATFYISPSGDDTRSCDLAQAIGTPRQHLRNILPCAAGTSTIILLNGTYTGVANTIDTSVVPIASGNSTTPTTIRAQTALGATIQLAAVEQGIRITTPTQWVTFDGLVISGGSVADAGMTLTGNADHIIFANGEITGMASGQMGLYLFGATNTTIVNSRIHHNGGPGFYLGSTTGTLITQSQIDNNVNGLQFLTGSPADSNLVITRNTINANTGTGILVSAIGTTPLQSLISNNIITSSAATTTGIRVLTGSNGLQILHNTITAHTTAALVIDSGAVNTLHDDNIYFASNVVTNNGTGTTTSVPTHNVTTDPSFTAGVTCGQGFHPTTSLTIGAGLGYAQASADFCGTTRSASTPTVGALEETAVAGPPPVTEFRSPYRSSHLFFP